MQSLRGSRLIAATLLVTANLFGAAASSSKSPTGIEGIILISHHPPRMSAEDVSAPMPLVDAPFLVQAGNSTVACFTTNERGRFRVLLAPGHYTVSQPPNSQVRRCGPWDVEVAAEGMTKVEWYCEATGRPMQR